MVKFIEKMEKKRFLFCFFSVNYQPGPSQPSIPFPSFDTTPLVVFPQPQTPIQVASGMIRKII
jgi:hypothetical protein